MADLIDANEAKQILGCDDATLKEYINTGQLRAQSVGGKLMINGNDVATLANSVESDDGTIILSEDSEDLSIDLGEVVDDSAATMVGDQDSDDGGITFDESDQLEVVDFEDSASDNVQLDDTGQTEGLSFTESNTAVMTSVDETIVDGTVSDLQTVDYDDYDDDDVDDRRRGSARRSVHSQRYANTAPAEEPVGLGWNIALALTTIIIALLAGPFLLLASTPSDEETFHTGEKTQGTIDGYWSELATMIAGFSAAPDRETHQLTSPDSEWRPMPGSPNWRHEQWRGDVETGPDLIERFQIDQVELDPTTQQPTQAMALSDEGETLKTYQVSPITNEDGQITGYRIGD